MDLGDFSGDTADLVFPDIDQEAKEISRICTYFWKGYQIWAKDFRFVASKKRGKKTCHRLGWNFAQRQSSRL
jgi:hypothetical protein